MDKLMSVLAKAQAHTALVLLMVLLYDLWVRHTTGEGIQHDALMALAAFGAGALGAKRPSDVRAS